MYFGSDNQTGASDKVFAALQKANEDIMAPYGEDQWSQKAIQQLQEIFDHEAEIYFVSTGTAANSLTLSSMVNPWDSILCHGQAHIINDELTAPEFFTGGARLIGLAPNQPKLPLNVVTEFLAQGATHPPHNSVPKALSLTQLTESGQIYSLEELKALTSIAHQYGLTVHMDGARFTNALVSLNCTPADMSWKAGIDVLSLGATKNGALSAEAVVFFNKELAKDFVAQRKRAGHLISKGRWLGAQFVGWLEDDHWLSLAQQANHMAALLHHAFEKHPDYQVIWPVPANELFVIMNNDNKERLRAKGAVFYEWPTKFLPSDLVINSNQDAVRLVTSFKTTADDVNSFIELL